jgi:hypothetical protein
MHAHLLRRVRARRPRCSLDSEPWLGQEQGRTYLRPAQGKCLHCYFCFVDDEFGLSYLRVPTWAPFGLQIYCNGHSALTRSLTREGIEFAQEDNAFLRLANLARAQALADGFAQDDWHWSLRSAPRKSSPAWRWLTNGCSATRRGRSCRC